MDVRAWFLDYVSAFEPLPPFLTLKKEHSLRVSHNSRAMAEALSWDPPLIVLAEASGVLHDIGRFSQYRDFDTVHDGPSDHGDAGYDVLVAEFPWESTNLEPDPILDVARFHNKRAIPPDCPPTSLPFVRLVRDADKIDILEVIQSYVIRGDVDEIYPGIDPTGPPTPEILSSILQTTRSPTEHADTLADLLLIKLTWVYDMNFKPTYWHLDKSGLFDWYASNLPPTPEIGQIVSAARDHILAHLVSDPDT